MTVSERLLSCWGPTWLARRSPVKQASEITSIGFEWTTKRFLWCPFQCIEWWRPHQSLQPSFMALSSRAIFMFRWIRLSVTRKTHLEQFYGSVIISLFIVCHVKNLRVFVSHNSAGFYWTFHLHILYERLKNFRQKCYIRPAKLLKYVNNCRVWTLMILKKCFRARAASCVLYNRTGHSQGFSIC